MATCYAPEQKTREKWPRPEVCGCGADVVLLVGAEWLVLVDAMPVLPEHPCGACGGRGARRVPQYVGTSGRLGGGKPGALGDRYGRMTDGTVTSCPQCRGTGRRGEPIGNEHVCVSEEGVVRSGLVQITGFDAFYRRHRCSSDHDPEED